MQNGTILVTSDGEMQVALNSTPIRITVDFSDEGILTPCNPHYFDTLTWEINKNILTVRWQVAGIREILYHAWFYWSELNDNDSDDK